MKLFTDKKTKIVCTIGPASDNEPMIRKLYAAGMNVMRVNFSHGTHEEQLAKIKIARSLEKEGIYLPVALDTKGPEIRTGKMEGGIVQVSKGQTIRLAMGKDILGNSERIGISYVGLYDDVNIGDRKSVV